MAESLVQKLRAERQFASALRRPVIFICHGLGGTIVKKSLIYSSTRTASKITHLRDLYVSTYAILFFGTPHGKVTESAWSSLGKAPRTTRQLISSGLNQAQRGDGRATVFQAIETEFSPLAKQFRMFFFWEELPTVISGGRLALIVDSESAAPDLDNIETAGIHATHSGMTKFSSRYSSGYRTVLAALEAYCEQAPRVISHRWEQEELVLRQRRAGEIWELGGFEPDIHPQIHQHEDTTAERPFFPPQDSTSSFIGREDKFAKLENSFFPDRRPSSTFGRKSFVVFGMGGSGKTELCSKFASTHRHRYSCLNRAPSWRHHANICYRYSAIFTIHAASKQMVADSLGRIGTFAGLESTPSSAWHYLSTLSSPWLLIIDNADDPSLDLRSLIPPGNAAHILITTRNSDFRREGTLGFMELQGLKEEEALELLLIKANIPAPWDTPTRKAGISIAKTLGYLALALVQAGNIIYRRVCDLGEYLNLFSATRSALQRRRLDTTAQGQDHESDIVKAVYSTFDVSLGFLHRTRGIKGQDASDLLKIMSFYHFDNIPIEIFSRAVASRASVGLSTASQSFSSRLLASLVSRLEPPELLPNFLKGDIDKYRVNWAIAELTSLSLITSNGKYISLHPLIHAWARDCLSSPERHIWASISFNLLMASVSLPPSSSSESDGEFHRDILPHLDACLAERGNPLSQTSVTGIVWIPPSIAQILQPTMFLNLRDQAQRAAKCGWVFAERGQFQKASNHLLAVKNVLLQTLGVQNEKTMVSMLGLAGVYWGLGRLEEAISLQRTVMDTREKLFGPVSEHTLQAMDHLGRSYWLHGLYREALDLQNLTSERMSGIGPQHPFYAQRLAAMDNLGVTLGSWRQYEASMKIHREALSGRCILLGETHLDTLTTKSNLAMALLDLGELEEADTLMQEVYSQRRQQLGKEHPWTLWALCYLAKVMIALGHIDQAEEILVWGVQAGTRSLAKDHLGVLMGRGELARVYARQGKLDQAEEITLETLRLGEISRGEAHPDCVYGGWKLAQLYVLKGESSKAIPVCEKALQRVDMRLGRDHPLGKDIVEMLAVLQDPSSSDADLANLVPTFKPLGRSSTSAYMFSTTRSSTW